MHWRLPVTDAADGRDTIWPINYASDRECSVLTAIAEVNVTLEGVIFQFNERHRRLAACPFDYARDRPGFEPRREMKFESRNRCALSMWSCFAKA